MTDKELDDLEARLREYARERRNTNIEDMGRHGYRGDHPPVERYIESQAANAIAELRKKNAGLVGALDTAIDEHLKALACSSQQQTREHYSNAYVALHNALQENTQ